MITAAAVISANLTKEIIMPAKMFTGARSGHHDHAIVTVHKSVAKIGDHDDDDSGK